MLLFKKPTPFKKTEGFLITSCSKWITDGALAIRITELPEYMKHQLAGTPEEDRMIYFCEKKNDKGERPSMKNTLKECLIKKTGKIGTKSKDKKTTTPEINPKEFEKLETTWLMRNTRHGEPCIQLKSEHHLVWVNSLYLRNMFYYLSPATTDIYIPINNKTPYNPLVFVDNRTSDAIGILMPVQVNDRDDYIKSSDLPANKKEREKQ